LNIDLSFFVVVSLIIFSAHSFRVTENLTGQDLEALFTFIDDIDMQASSSDPRVLVGLLGSRLCTEPLELDKEHS
jgi:hypothetical protein